MKENFKFYIIAIICTIVAFIAWLIGMYIIYIIAPLLFAIPSFLLKLFSIPILLVTTILICEYFADKILNCFDNDSN